MTGTKQGGLRIDKVSASHLIALLSHVFLESFPLLIVLQLLPGEHIRAAQHLRGKRQGNDIENRLIARDIKSGKDEVEGREDSRR